MKDLLYYCFNNQIFYTCIRINIWLVTFLDFKIKIALQNSVKFKNKKINDNNRNDIKIILSTYRS